MDNFIAEISTVGFDFAPTGWAHCDAHLFHHALLLYIGISLIFGYFMRYGGCEVVSIPSLLLATRHQVYCPLNAVDVVEQAVVGRRGTIANRARS